MSTKSSDASAQLAATQVRALMASAEATRERSEYVLAVFIRQFTEVCARHPALPIVLLPSSLDPSGHDADKAILAVSFHDLVEFISKLLKQCGSYVRIADTPEDVADFTLCSLLMWIVRHPEGYGPIDGAEMTLYALPIH